MINKTLTFLNIPFLVNARLYVALWTSIFLFFCMTTMSQATNLETNQHHKNGNKLTNLGDLWKTSDFLDDKRNLDRVKAITHLFYDESKSDQNAYWNLYLIHRIYKNQPDLEKQLLNILKTRLPKGESSYFLFEPAPSQLSQKVRLLKKRIWVSEDFPEIAKWAKRNDPFLDSIVEASEKDYFFMPPIFPIQNNRDKVSCASTICGLRDICDWLTIRAGLHLGEKEYDQSYSCIMALHRLGRLAQTQKTFLASYIGTQMELRAIVLHRDFLIHSRCSSQYYRKKAREINEQLPQKLPCVTYKEILAFYIWAEVDLKEFRQKIKEIPFNPLMDISEKKLPDFIYDSKNKDKIYRLIDWETVDEHQKQQFEKMVSLVEKETTFYQQRKEFLLLCSKAKQQREKNFLPTMTSLSPKSATNAVCWLLNRINVEGIPGKLDQMAALNTYTRMIIIAYALESWRKDHGGNYPKTLEFLSEKKYLADHKILQDLFTSKTFCYQSFQEDGHAIISSGPDGIVEKYSPDYIKKIKQKFSWRTNLSGLEMMMRTCADAHGDDIILWIPREKSQENGTAPGPISENR